MDSHMDYHEMDAIQPMKDPYEQPESIISELGQTRRRGRTLNHKGKAIRKNVVNFLPSRNLGPLGMPDVDTTDGSTISRASALDVQADQIVQRLEKDKELMEDKPKSEKDRMETLRNMAENLTLKRTVKKKLTKTVSSKSKGRPISFIKRTKYEISIFFSKLITNFKNLLYTSEFWYSSLKTIEGHFGSGVATYFKFLRKLFILDVIVFLINLSFIVLPQLLFRLLQVTDHNFVNSTLTEWNMTDVEPVLDLRRSMVQPLVMMKSNPYKDNEEFRFGNLFTGEGFLTSTVLYYGYYTNVSLSLSEGYSYHIPTAYFFSAAVCYFIMFLALAISTAVSYRKSFIETCGDLPNVFAHKIFCGWDFGVATKQAADLKSRSIYMELKEFLEDRKRQEKERKWADVFYFGLIQISLNALLLLVLGTVGYFTWTYLEDNIKTMDTATTMMMSLVLTLIILLGPMFFSWIIQFEGYHSPRSRLYVTLIRTAVLEAVVIGIVVAYRLHYSDSGSCWETALGQEVYRLVLLDFIFGLIGTALAEFVRFRIFTTLWSKIGCPEFDIARNTMNLIYNQTLFFVGLYFSPVLSAVIIFKLLLTFYIKKWGAIYNCRPSSRSWRAAQTQTVFLAISFLAFLGVVTLYGYILTSVETSNCGPFRGGHIMYESVLNEIFRGEENSVILSIIHYVSKPGVVGVILIAILLAVYYLRAVGKARKRVVRILREILLLQAKDKQFLLERIAMVSEGNPYMLRRSEMDERMTLDSNFESGYYEATKKKSIGDHEEQDRYEEVLKQGVRFSKRADDDLTAPNKYGRVHLRGVPSGHFRSTQNITSYEDDRIEPDRRYQSCHNVYDEHVTTDIAAWAQGSTSGLLGKSERRSLDELPQYASADSSSRNYGFQNDEGVDQDDLRSNRKINFNPVYTESIPADYSSDEDEGHRGRNNRPADRDYAQDVDYQDMSSRHVPFDTDDRIPSRITFEYASGNVKKHR